MTIAYNRSLDIRNTDALPKGLGCKYLLCIQGPGGVLIAKAWKRKAPARLLAGEVLVTF